jgi:type IV secretory pathway VirB10-like protein
MRRAANDNPVVRLALIGVLLIGFAFLLYTRVLSQSEETSAPPPTPATGTSTSTPVPPAAAPSPTATVPTSPAPSAGATAPAPLPPPAAPGPESLKPGPGLPKDVVTAYKHGDAVVVLIAKPRAIDDRRVRAALASLNGRHDAAVFVTRPKHIARYSRITQGVSVSRTPALVVVRPRRLSGDVPKATVSYGFRGPASVVQAVRDALYKGPKVPYYPE